MISPTNSHIGSYTDYTNKICCQIPDLQLSCILTSTSFSTSSAIAGGSLDLIANGTNCAGMTVDFTISDKSSGVVRDSASSTFPSLASGSNGLIQGWTTPTGDSGTYILNATVYLGSSILTTIDSANNLVVTIPSTSSCYTSCSSYDGNQNLCGSDPGCDSVSAATYMFQNPISPYNSTNPAPTSYYCNWTSNDITDSSNNVIDAANTCFYVSSYTPVSCTPEITSTGWGDCTNGVEIQAYYDANNCSGFSLPSPVCNSAGTVCSITYGGNVYSTSNTCTSGGSLYDTCSTGGQCVAVAGSGASTCTLGNSCSAPSGTTYDTCSTGGQCVAVAGSGASTCTLGNSCSAPSPPDSGCSVSDSTRTNWQCGAETICQDGEQSRTCICKGTTATDSQSCSGPSIPYCGVGTTLCYNSSSLITDNSQRYSCQSQDCSSLGDPNVATPNSNGDNICGYGEGCGSYDCLNYPGSDTCVSSLGTAVCSSISHLCANPSGMTTPGNNLPCGVGYIQCVSNRVNSCYLGSSCPLGTNPVSCSSNSCLIGLSCSGGFCSSPTPPVVGNCTITSSVTNSSCQNGFITYNIIAKWSGSGSAPASCQSGTETIECPAQISLPFFTVFNVIMTVVILALIYLAVILARKRSSKNKSATRRNNRNSRRKKH